MSGSASAAGAATKKAEGGDERKDAIAAAVETLQAWCGRVKQGHHEMSAKEVAAVHTLAAASRADAAETLVECVRTVISVDAELLAPVTANLFDATNFKWQDQNCHVAAGLRLELLPEPRLLELACRVRDRREIVGEADGFRVCELSLIHI